MRLAVEGERGDPEIALGKLAVDKRQGQIVFIETPRPADKAKPVEALVLDDVEHVGIWHGRAVAPLRRGPEKHTHGPLDVRPGRRSGLFPQRSENGGFGPERG